VAVKRALLLALAVALLAGCGGSDGSADEGLTESGTDTFTLTVPATTDGRVYFLRDGKVWPVAREISVGDDAPGDILAALEEGPTAQETADLGLESGVGTIRTYDLIVKPGVATFVDLDGDVSAAGIAQVVYSLTQLDPVVKWVKIDGKRYTRADFEEQTPPVLVESPLPFEEVASPLHVEGTANTFEATFNYELTDTDGRIVDENFVTATSGTGTRGTFEFTTQPYSVPFDGIGSLIVFERSAEDGSRIHVVEIPLRMPQ
jgi:Immunoglobulin-like domain of bacterial spore germination